jgi:hypothetical protein
VLRGGHPWRCSEALVEVVADGDGTAAPVTRTAGFGFGAVDGLDEDLAGAAEELLVLAALAAETVEFDAIDAGAVAALEPEELDEDDEEDEPGNGVVEQGEDVGDAEAEEAEEHAQKKEPDNDIAAPYTAPAFVGGGGRRGVGLIGVGQGWLIRQKVAISMERTS